MANESKKIPGTEMTWAEYHKALEARWAKREPLSRRHTDPCINTYATIRSLWR